MKLYNSLYIKTFESGFLGLLSILLSEREGKGGGEERGSEEGERKGRRKGESM